MGSLLYKIVDQVGKVGELPPRDRETHTVTLAVSERCHQERDSSVNYYVIYDGKCNLCVTFTQLLETFDRGQRFHYLPMQDEATLTQLGMTPQDCEMGMILMDAQNFQRRWQGSEAAEEIIRLLPRGKAFMAAYRALPGIKWLGDLTYERVRDNRYRWFGKRQATYRSSHSPICQFGGACGEGEPPLPTPQTHEFPHSIPLHRHPGSQNPLP